jgi:hypothetical protein
LQKVRQSSGAQIFLGGIVTECGKNIQRPYVANLCCEQMSV